ncbi:MAG: hypothetical protein AB7P04_01230 [Bacteriovoracia bacterium]
MFKAFKVLSLIAMVSALVPASALADLPEGSFRGDSSLFKFGPLSTYSMTLLIKKDPNKADRYYAVLAEYEVLPFTDTVITDIFSDKKRSAITKWVYRMHAYQMDKGNDYTYVLRPLTVAGGAIVPKTDVVYDVLTLKKPDQIKGATLTRREKGKKEAVETIHFKGNWNSTWENYVVGKFLGTTRSSGLDYLLNKSYNTETFANGQVVFNWEGAKGTFALSESVPGLFVMKAVEADEANTAKLEAKIAFFVDIVNWKPKATTNELMLINPSDPKDVGFYYERHEKDLAKEEPKENEKK